MPIPDYRTLMLPLLRAVADKREYSVDEVVRALEQEFRLSPAERAQLLPSGRAPLFRNRVGWARTYLKKAGLLESSRRGRLRITDRGLSALNEVGVGIDTRYLQQFPEFRAFVRGGSSEEPQAITRIETEPGGEPTPTEQLDYAFGRLREALASEVLELAQKVDPARFEKLVIDLLLAMGYGGSLRDAGQAIGKSGDAGIDGVIKEDRLGLDQIYVQAKRWEGTVGRPEIQRFAGALQGQRARKGVFITTSDFSAEARQFAAMIDTRIVLIDGRQLAQFMIDHGVGVTVVDSYEVKRVDQDYFSEV